MLLCHNPPSLSSYEMNSSSPYEYPSTLSLIPGHLSASVTSTDAISPYQYFGGRSQMDVDFASLDNAADFNSSHDQGHFPHPSFDMMANANWNAFIEKSIMQTQSHYHNHNPFGSINQYNQGALAKIGTGPQLPFNTSPNFKQISPRSVVTSGATESLPDSDQSEPHTGAHSQVSPNTKVLPNDKTKLTYQQLASPHSQQSPTSVTSTQQSFQKFSSVEMSKSNSTWTRSVDSSNSQANSSIPSQTNTSFWSNIPSSTYTNIKKSVKKTDNDSLRQMASLTDIGYIDPSGSNASNNQFVAPLPATTTYFSLNNSTRHISGNKLHGSSVVHSMQNSSKGSPSNQSYRASGVTSLDSSSLRHQRNMTLESLQQCLNPVLNNGNNFQHSRPHFTINPAKNQPRLSYAWMKPSTYQSSAPAKGKTRTPDKYRIVYSDFQRLELEKEFITSKYITSKRKIELSRLLNLSERQIKIWFQNRRAKDRKSGKKSIPSVTNVKSEAEK